MYTRVFFDGGFDEVAIEEPLEIRVDGEPLAVTMRTPGWRVIGPVTSIVLAARSSVRSNRPVACRPPVGHDEELALGFLYGEGLIDGPRHAGATTRWTRWSGGRCSTAWSRSDSGSCA